MVTTESFHTAKGGSGHDHTVHTSPAEGRHCVAFKRHCAITTRQQHQEEEEEKSRMFPFSQRARESVWKDVKKKNKEIEIWNSFVLSRAEGQAERALASGGASVFTVIICSLSAAAAAAHMADHGF